MLGRGQEWLDRPNTLLRAREDLRGEAANTGGGEGRRTPAEPATRAGFRRELRRGGGSVGLAAMGGEDEEGETGGGGTPYRLIQSATSMTEEVSREPVGVT